VPSGNVSQYKEEEMQTILISILTAAITTKIIATYYFKKIDGYEKEMSKEIRKSNKRTEAVLDKIEERLKD